MFLANISYLSDNPMSAVSGSIFYTDYDTEIIDSLVQAQQSNFYSIRSLIPFS
jgi:hypothetical protein